MKIRAHAKINLALDVVSEREDGYHELRMLMAPISLHDLIYVDIIEEGIEITCDNPRIPTNEKNIVYKVADRLMKDYDIKKGVHIHIYKHIPSQAGLAGGSADGAAVMIAMNKIFKLNLSLEKLAEIGATIGADIPFCIYSKLADVRGIGEKLEFLDQSFKCKLLLVKPMRGVSTKKCFQALKMDEAVHPDIELQKNGILNSNYEDVVKGLGNTLEGPSIEFVPDIQKIKDQMLEMGFDGALMSGSGSCVFGMTRDEAILDTANAYFRKCYRFVRIAEII